jgi:general secretion pathway protein F
MKLAYRAYDANGRIVDGEHEGRNVADIIARLRQAGLVPFETSENAGVKKEHWLNRDIGRVGLSLQERARFSRVLAALLSAGVPLDRSLRLMSDKSHGRRMAQVAEIAADAVSGGQALSKVLASPLSGFQPHEIGLIQSAERSGAFPPILQDLANSLDRKVELRGKITSAMVYPLVLLIMSGMSLTVILTVLIPNLMPLLAQTDKELPIMLTVLIGATDFATQNTKLLLAVGAVACVLAFLAFRSESIRDAWRSLLLRFRLFRNLESARAFQTLGTLLRNGVPLQASLLASAKTVKSLKVASEIEAATEEVVGGAKLAHAMRNVTVVDSQARQLISAGEETNQLSDLLLYLANSLEQQSTRSIEQLMTLLTPLMTVGLGMLIGGLILSVMRVILSVNELAL